MIIDSSSSRVVLVIDWDLNIVCSVTNWMAEKIVYRSSSERCTQTHTLTHKGICVKIGVNFIFFERASLACPGSEGSEKIINILIRNHLCANAHLLAVECILCNWIEAALFGSRCSWPLRFGRAERMIMAGARERRRVRRCERVQQILSACIHKSCYPCPCTVQ